MLSFTQYLQQQQSQFRCQAGAGGTHSVQLTQHNAVVAEFVGLSRIELDQLAAELSRYINTLAAPPAAP
jgi:hypothetical protein